MIKAIAAVLMSAMLIVFLAGCGQSDQPAKPQPPAKTEQPKAVQPKAEPAKPEHPKVEPVKPEQPKAEQPKPDHPQGDQPKHEHPK